MVKFEQSARRTCEEIFGSAVLRTSSAGRSKQVVRFFLEDGRSMIATRRMTAARANLEFHVLQKLYSHGARVPKVLAFDGRLLFQEDLGQKRLSLILKDANCSQGEKLLESSLTSLAETHARGKAAGLGRVVATLGEGDDWLRILIDRPRVLGEFLRIPVPELPIDRLVELLRVTKVNFIKWDARPPNAVVLEDGNLGWVDWENCGRRNRLDDLAWFFGDQSVPDWPEVEERLLDRHLPAFIDNMNLDEARDYLAVYGTLHMCVRLSQILNREKKRGLEDWSSKSSGDRTAERALSSARTMSVRASRWAGRSPLIGSLSSWLLEVADRIVVAEQPVVFQFSADRTYAASR